MSKEYGFERTIVEHPIKEETPKVMNASELIALFATPNPALDIPIKNEMDTVCENCGGDKIQEKYWVETNTLKILHCVDDCDDYPNYCPDCGDYVDVIYRKDFKYEDSKKDDKKDELKVGDRVRIAEDSDFYDDGADNPKDEVGTIIENCSAVDDELPYKVQWKGCTNVYAKHDLEKVYEY